MGTEVAVLIADRSLSAKMHQTGSWAWVPRVTAFINGFLGVVRPFNLLYINHWTLPFILTPNHRTQKNMSADECIWNKEVR